MLCDSGATISVIADALIPKHVPLQEEVLVITATGLATPYPTALVPATVNGREMELFAAVVPAEKMTYPVILGRFIPNMEVKWTMEVGNDEGTLLKLQQTTEAQELPSVLRKAQSATKTSRRKNKFKKMSEKERMIEKKVATDEVLLKVQPTAEAQELLPILQKTQLATKTSRRKTKFKTMVEKRVQFTEDTDARSGVVAGESTSQEVEERADTIPSPLSKEVWPGKSKHQSGLTTPPNLEIQEIANVTTMAVQTRAQSKKQREQKEADEAATTTSGVVLTPIQSEDDVPDDCDDAVATTLAQPTGCEEAQSDDDTTVVTRAQLSEMQFDDPALRQMFLEADGEDSLFQVQNGLLYRKRYLESEEDDYQIVVPTTLRCKVMQAGHNQSGHFGINKTKILIQKHFYWPRMGQEINQHCKTCPRCLKFNYKKRSKEPLHPLPVISTPWRRIAIDIVGKLPRTQNGNSYILTIMDFATRYMEAIPLKRVDADTTCSALMEVFARYGIPEEVLSDNGCNFIANVTETLMKMLKIYHIKASPYHPETNGMLERSHQVLKKTLDKLGATKKNWDDYLAPTLMALRTAPHSALGISPFHLLFGRDAKTPVATMKDKMEELKTAPKSVVAYIHQLYKQFEDCQKIVEIEDTKAKQRSKSHYDKNKTSDPLKDGELVMMLVPRDYESLTCHWDGPFKVIRRLSDTTYLLDVSTGHRKKKQKKCHRNLLKRYFIQAMSAVVMLAAEGDESAECSVPPPTETSFEEKWETCRKNDRLTDQQLGELKSTLQHFDAVFQDTPGRADVTPFRIETGDAKPISACPRRIPDRWRSKIQQELKNLLQAGIIVPSRSPWASPIVPVPKPNDEVRMCVDYRSLNAVTQSDVYPLPHIEKLLEEVSKSHYITTLDLVKGYYQFPVLEDHQCKTAFVTPNGKWEFTRMPFGLKGAPAQFQREMDDLFQQDENMSAYIDDVAIYSLTWSQHLKDISAALTKLKEKGLTVKIKKCKFAQQHAEFLGHVVGDGKLHPQEAKVMAIKDFPVPRTKKQVHSFLGSTGYYRRFIPRYSSIAACL